MSRRVNIDWDEPRRLYESGMSTRAVAQVLGVSATFVTRVLREMGVRIRHTGTEIERFMDRVPESHGDECWVWSGAKNSCSYPTFKKGRHPDRTTVLAHRWSYEHFVGPIGENLEIDHLCRNTLCVNPQHLEAVTHRENLRRAPGSIMNRAKRGELLGHRKKLMVEKVMRAWPVTSPFVEAERGGEDG